MVSVPLVYKEVLFPLDKVNKELRLYTDKVVLLLEGDIHTMKADFKFHWLPNYGVEMAFRSNTIFALFPRFELISNMLLPVNGRVTGGNIGKRPNSYFSLLSKDEKKWEEWDEDLDYDRFEFQIPNFKPMFGVNCNIRNEFSTCRHYILFEDYEVEIHPRYEINKLFESAVNEGGFVCTHVGHISKKLGKIKLKEAAKITTAIGDICSLLIGKNAYPTMLTGIQNEKASSLIPFLGKIDQAKKHGSLVPYTENNVISTIFSTYFKLVNPHWNNEIKQILFWYLQANSWSSAESTVALTQIALEMASWIELVENNSLVSNGGFENLPAADKIKLLANSLKLDVSFTKLLKELESFGKAYQGPDAVTAFVNIRNNIIHPKKKNRDQISKPEHKRAIIEAGHVGLHLVEMYLLYRFGYKGKVENRLTGEVMQTPWL